MTLARAVGRNTIIQFAGKAVGTLFGLLTSVLILRYLHPEGNGAYTTAMAYLGFCSVIADLGLYLILIRDLNRPGANAERIVGNLLALRWVSAGAILALGGGLVLLFGFTPQEQGAIWIGTFAFVGIAATQLLVGVFQSKLAMIYVTAGELIGRIALLAATWWVIQAHGSLYAIITAVVGGSAINFLFVWWAVRRFLRIRLYADWAYWRSTLRDTMPIAISIVLNLIYFRADTIILRLYHGAYDVGLYGAAYKILEILNTFPLMFVGLILPALGQAFSTHDQDTFRRIFQKGFDLLLMGAAPILIGGWLLAEPLITLVGGAEYAPAVPVFRLLLIAVGALFLGSLSGHVITIINRQRQMVWTYLGVAAVGLALYFVLIPRFSMYGAATGTIITELLIALVGYLLILRVMGFRLQLRSFPGLILSGGVMAAFIILTRELNFWVAGIGGFALYLGMLFLTRLLSPRVVHDILARQSTTVSTLPQ